MLPPENLNFLNVRNAGFWHSDRLFALLQMLALQNLKGFLGGDPLLSPPFFLLTSPLKP